MHIMCEGEEWSFKKFMKNACYLLISFSTILKVHVNDNMQ